MCEGLVKQTLVDSRKDRTLCYNMLTDPCPGVMHIGKEQAECCFLASIQTPGYRCIEVWPTFAT